MPNPTKVSLPYFGYHPYNNPTHAERNIELPIAFWFLQKFQADLADLIEVGEVTPFYCPPKHRVYDPAAEKPGTINADATEIDYVGKNLLSISTIEHVGTSDYGQTPDLHRLPKVLEKMMQSKNYLITFALGYNQQLEEMVQDRPHLMFERIAPTRWRQVKNKRFADYKYHSPWYAGNGVCILTNLPNLEFEFTSQSQFRVMTRCSAPNWSWKNFVKAWRQERADARTLQSKA